MTMFCKNCKENITTLPDCYSIIIAQIMRLCVSYGVKIMNELGGTEKEARILLRYKLMIMSNFTRVIPE
jgi:hypothetical protein